MGTIYLIPNTIGDSPADLTIPAGVMAIVRNLQVFFVEDLRSARRFLKKLDKDIIIDEREFIPIGKHSSPTQALTELRRLKDKNLNGGIISEAGAPCIADPGAALVSSAHDMNIQIIPLTGPSSILLALMASGFNGQNFAFHGYLPKHEKDRAQKIKELEKIAREQDQTQIFMEAPYRNNQLLESILRNCALDTRLSISADLTSASEFIDTGPIARWKTGKPDLHKRPAIFLLYK